MQLFDRGGQVVSRMTPNPTIAPGWPNNDLTQTTDPTVMDPDWCAAVTAELLGLLTQTGQTASKTNVGQVLQAVMEIAGGYCTTVSAATPVLTAQNAGLVLVNAAANNVAITLPAAASAGGQSFEFIFVRTDTSAHTVSWAVPGSGAGSTDTAVPGRQLAGGACGRRLCADPQRRRQQVGRHRRRRRRQRRAIRSLQRSSTSSPSGVDGRDSANYALRSQAVTFPCSTSRHRSASAAKWMAARLPSGATLKSGQLRTEDSRWRSRTARTERSPAAQWTDLEPGSRPRSSRWRAASTIPDARRARRNDHAHIDGRHRRRRA